jgi:hypothetical protein
MFSVIARFSSSDRCSCGLRSSWVLQGLGMRLVDLLGCHTVFVGNYCQQVITSHC